MNMPVYSKSDSLSSPSWNKILSWFAFTQIVFGFLLLIRTFWEDGLIHADSQGTLILDPKVVFSVLGSYLLILLSPYLWLATSKRFNVSIVANLTPKEYLKELYKFKRTKFPILMSRTASCISITILLEANVLWATAASFLLWILWEMQRMRLFSGEVNKPEAVKSISVRSFRVVLDEFGNLNLDSSQKQPVDVSFFENIQSLKDGLLETIPQTRYTFKEVLITSLPKIKSENAVLRTDSTLYRQMQSHSFDGDQEFDYLQNFFQALISPSLVLRVIPANQVLVDFEAGGGWAGPTKWFLQLEVPVTENFQTLFSPAILGEILNHSRGNLIAFKQELDSLPVGLPRIGKGEDSEDFFLE